MKITGIIASPHKEGNTAWIVNKILEGAKERGAGTESWYFSDLDIRPCRGCNGCKKGDKGCIMNDDMQKLYGAIEHAGAIVLGSPVYMGMISGQLKTMIDRTVLFRIGGEFELSGRVGAGIACGGFRNGGQELVLQSIHTYLLQLDMFAIADGPPFSHSGAAITGLAEQDELGMGTVESLARRVAAAVKRISQ